MAEATLRQWLEHDRLTLEQARGLLVETLVRAGEGILDDLAEVIGER